MGDIWQQECPTMAYNPTSPSSLRTRPLENWKEGLGDRLGQKCTMCPECRRASDWFMITCLDTFIGNVNRNPLVQFKNKQGLLAREVVGAQINYFWAHRRLEVPEIKRVQTSNSNSIHSTQYTSTSAYHPDPPSDFPRVWF